MMKNDEAVSPVIGVILMVAITVILAAVIAAFVFGLAGITSTTKNVGLTLQQNATGGITITIQGGTDIPQLNELNILVDGAANVTAGVAPFNVGQVLYGAATDYSTKKVSIVGKFKDGSEVVLLDRQF
jgi:flagellin-like protein